MTDATQPLPLAAPETARRPRWNKFARDNWLHLLMVPLALLWLSPLIWILITSLKTRCSTRLPGSGRAS